MVRNLWRMIEKAGFAIFMFSMVAIAIGWARGFMPIVYVGLAVVLITGVIVLFRANRSVSGRPKPRPAGEASAASPTRSATSSGSKKGASSISDPDRY